MIGTYRTEDLMQKWFLRNLPKAKELLANFESLNTLLNGFENYETKCYREIRNQIMFLCLPSMTGGLKEDAIQRLTRMEKAVEIFNILKLSQAKLSAFRSRLASEDYIQSLSAATELEVAFELTKRIGEGKVELYPSIEGGRFSDISAEIGTKKIYIEVGNLGESLPQKKIQDILNSSAKHLGEKITGNFYLNIHVDTAELVLDEQGNIQVADSIKKLNAEMDLLALHKLAGFNGYFSISNVSSILRNLPLYERIEKLDPRTKEMLDLIRSDEIQNWLSSFNHRGFKDIHLIRSIIAGPSSSTLIEIHPVLFFPSKSGIAERNSYLNQLTRNISSQLEESQIQPDSPNIILVQGFNWIIFAFEDPNPLIEKLLIFFNEIRNPHLSGVAVFANKFREAIFIGNKYARPSSRLTKTDLDALGFHKCV